jgi:predicted permease
MSRIDALRARLRLIVTPRAAESRAAEEIRFHIEMETERLVRDERLDPAEAERRARATFGGVTQHRETLRDGRGFAWLNGRSLDFKLGLRMLAKYPGLTIVGLAGLSVTVAIGVVAFSAVSAVVDSSLPFDDGDRVVSIANVNQRAHDEGRATHLHDLPVWREALTTVTDLGADRVVERNLITRDGPPESIRVAEMSASGFRIGRRAPVLGRYFHEADERPGAAPVVVIGYDLWQRRFGGSADVIGKTVDIGEVRRTIVGVAPKEFAFPINNHIWTPLQLDPGAYAQGAAPSIEVFGRLAPGATLADAERQLATIGRRLAIADSAVHANVRPQVIPYTRIIIDDPSIAWSFHLIQVAVTLLLVVIGTNVAILVYARTASRAGEIAIRSALGASRGRVVAQLFTEALVLSSAAAVVGVIGAYVTLQQLDELLTRAAGEQFPFWLHFGITPGVAVYAMGMAVAGAIIVGVVPALKATRGAVHPNLQQFGAAHSGLKLGRTWTFLVVAQVAVSVAILPVALIGVRSWMVLATMHLSATSKQTLTATLSLDRGAGDSAAGHVPFASRYAELRRELEQRLEEEPGVAGATFAATVPGTEGQPRFELEGSSSNTFAVATNSVDLDFFDTFEMPALVGRRFHSADAAAGAHAIVVNRAFVDKVLHGANPLGRRIRVAQTQRQIAAGAKAEPWEEIVGVVPDIQSSTDTSAYGQSLYRPRLYRPLSATETRPLALLVRVRSGTPNAFGVRLREVALGVNSMLRLTEIATLEQRFSDNLAPLRLSLLAATLLTVSVLLLSAAGIYALVSFTVTRRRREIGIRAALGAGRGRVLSGILSRAMMQIGAGIAIGTLFSGIANALTAGEMTAGQGGWFLLPAVAAFMATVGLAAAFGPARRALQIQPTEALRAE